MAGRITLNEIAETRSQLAGFIATLKEAEAKIMKRAKRLWQTKIQTEADIDSISGELESLVSAFENLPRDLEDLQIMRHALKLYQKGYMRLSDENLNWNEFETLAEEIRKEWAAALGEEEPPWLPDDTLDGFDQAISKHRKQASTTWVESIEAQVENIPSMAADEANRFYNRVSIPPPVVTDSHLKRAAVVDKKIQARLGDLSVEWLLEKFKELPTKAKKDFLQRAQEFGDKGDFRK
jgi:chromosome segregation ATPase